MIDTILRELGAVVLCFVQAHYMRYTEMSEDLKVILWRVAAAVRALLVDRPHESNKFPREHPVKVTIFNFLIILVFLVVKLSEVVPAKIDGDL